MSMSLTKSFSLSLNDCKDPGKRQTEFHLFSDHAYAQYAYKLYFYTPFIVFVFFTLSDVSPVDMLSVSSQLDEVCTRVLVRTGDQTEVNTEHL